MSSKIIIIDDSPLGRQKLCRYLHGRRDVEVIGVYDHGPEAVDALRSDGPDLALCEIGMPDLRGMATLEQIEPDRLPRLVLVTTYDPGVVWSLQIRGVDLLLKPFDRDRFEWALERALTRLRSTGNAAATRQLLAAVSQVRAEWPAMPRTAVG